MTPDDPARAGGTFARRAALAALLGCGLLTACRQATPAEVGTQTTRDAHPMATMKASGRAQQASPVEVSPSASGAAMAQPK